VASPVSIIINAADRTKSAFASVKSGLAGLADRARSLGGIIAGLGVGLSLAGFVGTLKKTVDEMDAAAEAAERVGTSVENFSALGYVAKQSGADVQILEDGLLKLTRSLATAKEGSGPAADAFAKLEIDPAKFTDPAAALVALSDKFAALPDGVAKTSLAMDIFGKSGAKMIGMLNQGSDGIRQLADEAEALGVVFDSAAADAAGRLNDNLDKLKAAGTGLGAEVAAQVVPGLTQVSEAMVTAAKEGGLLSAAWVGLGGLGAALFTDTFTPLEKKLADLNAQLARATGGLFQSEGAAARLREQIALLEEQVAAEKKAMAADEERRRAQAAGKADAEAAIAAREKEVESVKAATKAKIAEAERERKALKAAYDDALNDQAKHNAEAAALRTQATSAGASGEDSASVRADAAIAGMALERIRANGGTPEEIRNQAEAVKELAGALEDRAFAGFLAERAAVAEAAAAQASAKAAGERAAAIAEQMESGDAPAGDEAVSQAKEITAAKAEAAQPVSVDITLSDKTNAALEALREMVRLVQLITSTPLQVNAAPPGGTATADAAIKTAALQYGRRS
jgi:hypothetical protein